MTRFASGFCVGLCLATASAAADTGLPISVAPKLGATVPTSKLGTTYFGALDVGYEIEPLRKLVGLPVGVALGLAYLEPGLSGTGSSAATGAYGYHLDERLLVLGAEVFAGLPLGALHPYGALGYGWYFLRSEVRSFGQTNRERQTRAGLQARGGVGYDLWLGQLFAELSYHYVGLEFRTTGDASAGGVTLAAGFRFELDRVLDASSAAGSASAGDNEARVVGRDIQLKNRVHFQADSAEIDLERSQRALHSVAEVLQANPNMKRVAVRGHTDATGDAKKNLELSRKRAEVVAEALAAMGIAPARLVPEGVGDAEPIASNDTEEGRFKNRRVEFRIIDD